MTEYRRFIAYVYEYRKGKKECNCGFLKVEMRNRVCTVEIHLQIEGMAAEEICRIYGFIRKEGLMNGILLGSCKTRKDQIDCILETDSTDMGASGIPLQKMGGMILITETGGFYGTEWDDQAIRPENFKESAEKPETKKALETENKEEVSEAEPQSEEPQAVELSEESEEPQVAELAEELEEPQAAELSEESEEPQAAELPKSPEEQQSEEILSKERKPEKETEEEESAEASETVSDSKPVHIQSVQSKENNTSLPFGQPFCPFTDGDLNQCWKIMPQDLVYFPRRQCALRNNRFLQYGYYNFGHLLLCRRQNGRYLLGVPGCYDQQEQFMAGMFGFSCFKESSLIKVKEGRGGYWYRAIDPPVCS